MSLSFGIAPQNDLRSHYTALSCLLPEQVSLSLEQRESTTVTKIIPSLCYNTYTYLPTPKYPVRKNREAGFFENARAICPQPATYPATYLFRYAF